MIKACISPVSYCMTFTEALFISVFSSSHDFAIVTQLDSSYFTTHRVLW